MSSTNGNSRFSIFFLQCFVIFVFIIQLFRLAGTGFSIFVIYDSLILKKKTPNLFDSVENPDLYLENNITKRDVTSADSAAEGVDPEWQNIVLICIPIVEVATACSLVYLITGPMSASIAPTQWLFWFLKMRVFWMRCVWTGTAIAYSILLIEYRSEMYLISNKEKYKDTATGMSVLGLIALEYISLGILQCAMKIITFEVVLEKIKNSKLRLTRRWKKLIMRCCYICILAFALRNFAMSLYFGLLSVIAEAENEDDENGENPYTGIVMVMQVYLALIRGKFYGFFIKDFFSTFLLEEDDEMFSEARTITGCDDIEAGRASEQKTNLLKNSKEGQTQV